jgi:heterodisulfide reductase subunit B
VADILKETIRKELKGHRLQLLYRGFFKKYGVLPRNNLSAIFFSPSLSYAKDYGDSTVYTTKPQKIFDIRTPKDFETMKFWLNKTILELEREKTDEDGFLPSRIRVYIKDAKRHLASNNPKDIIISMANLGIALFDGEVIVGAIEKKFMEDMDIDAMYVFEAGFLRTDQDEVSVAFRKMPPIKWLKI